MKDFRLYLFPVLLVLDVYLITVVFQMSWILGLILLGIVMYTAADMVYLYLNSIWWAYHNWISTNVVDIEEIKVPSTMKGEMLKAVIIRPKNCDRTKKHVGVLAHHGYTGKKEKMFRFAIPLAMNGCVVLCPDARGHGESTNKAFSMDDFKGIMSDITNEVDYLESLPEVDPNKLAMMGHSMGGIMTLSAGYQEDRLKKLIAISAPYNMLEMFQTHKTVITRYIYKHVTGFLKKDKEFQESGETLEEWSKQISAHHVFDYETPIPNKDRVFLVHCKEDDLVLFGESEKSKEHLKLPDENVLFLDMPKWKYLMAAHNLTGQETIISTFCVNVITSLK